MCSALEVYMFMMKSVCACVLCALGFVLIECENFKLFLSSLRLEYDNGLKWLYYSNLEFNV